MGASLIVSALIAAATIVYSYLNFREIRHEEAVEEAQEEAEERRRSQQSGR